MMGEMYNKRYLAILVVAVSVTIVAGASQMLPRVRASSAVSSSASVTVAASCSLVGTVNTAHTATINNGQSVNGIGDTTLNARCNDSSGFAIYAVGYGQDTVGTTVLHSDSLGTNYDIATGTGTGGASKWSMQVSAISEGTTVPSIQNSFDSPHVVPSQYTRVASFGSVTDATTGSSVKTTYNAYISSTQPAGTYVGQVKYILIHPSGSSISDDLTMQSVALWKDTMLDGETYKVVDERDNKEYYVAKLDDGNVWMTQNLDLCIGCTGTTALTSQNTDLNTAGSGIYSNGYSTDANGVITWTPSGNATITGTPATIPNFAYSSVSGWSDSNTYPYMAEGSTEYVVQGTPYATRAACVTAKDAVTCDHNHIGNYYNWTAAVASNDSSTITTKYATAANSVCPAGWRLPAGPDGTNGSTFNTLLSAANIANGTDNGSGSSAVNVGYKSGGFNKIESSPYYFARPGFVNGTTLYSFASLGHYWSGSAVSGSNAFNLYYSSSGLYPANQSNRNGGRSLRCVAR